MAFDRGGVQSDESGEAHCTITKTNGAEAPADTNRSAANVCNGSKADTSKFKLRHYRIFAPLAFCPPLGSIAAMKAAHHVRQLGGTMEAGRDEAGYATRIEFNFSGE